jgi:hypothetical protein
MNTTIWLSTLTAILGFLGVALGYIVKWIVANKDNIAALVLAVRDIHKIVKGAPSLPDPAPLPPAIASAPTTTPTTTPFDGQKPKV